jgi:hypothetical protein
MTIKPFNIQTMVVDMYFDNYRLFVSSHWATHINRSIATRAYSNFKDSMHNSAMILATIRTKDGQQIEIRPSPVKVLDKGAASSAKRNPRLTHTQPYT